jgi:hypothetical protein
MKQNMKTILLVVAAAISIAACANPSVSDKAVASTDSAVSGFYEVHKDGRLYAFSNADTYKGFLHNGEAAYVLTRIGKGPKNNTLVYGLTKDESKDPAAQPFVKLYEDEIEAAHEGFYGETFYEGRYYAFDSWEDMKEFRMKGEAPIVFTMIAKGPERATLVMVRNKESAKNQAASDALYARFKANHGL